MKNKKGSLILNIIFLLAIIGLIYMVIGLVFITRSNAEGKACREIGFENYDFFGARKFCIDEEGIYYEIDLKCANVVVAWWKYDCKAKVVKFGALE